jgi:ABC-2 type transport system ATP-binding protein
MTYVLLAQLKHLLVVNRWGHVNMKNIWGNIIMTTHLQNTSNTEYAVEVQNLCKSFKQLSVLDGVSFNIARGNIFALLGQNGAGKTTTIRILSTLLTPDSGNAKIAGFDILTQGYHVRRSIGLTGQYAAVDDLLNAIENLQMMGQLYHLSTKKAQIRTQELIEQFDLGGFAKRQVKTYSGGMRRRLDIAMGLIASPPVIFLDEPTTGLDPRSRISMWNAIRNLAQNGTTILLTTQYMDEAENLADRIAVLNNGTIITEGTVSELKSLIGSARVVVSFTHDGEVSAACDIFSSEDILLDMQRRTLTVTAENGTQKIKEIINRLEEKSISIDSIALQHPTLDDVFLALTGHKAAQNTTSDKD